MNEKSNANQLMSFPIAEMDENKSLFVYQLSDDDGYFWIISVIKQKITAISVWLLSKQNQSSVFDYNSSSSLVQQPLSVKPCLYHLWGWLSVTYGLPPHSRIVSPTYGGTVHLGLEPITGMLLSRTS